MENVILVIDGQTHTLVADEHTVLHIERLLRYQRDHFEKCAMNTDEMNEKRAVLLKRVSELFPARDLCSTTVKNLLRQVGYWHLFDALLLTRHQWHENLRFRESTIAIFESQIEEYGLRVSTHFDEVALNTWRSEIGGYDMPWEIRRLQGL